MKTQPNAPINVVHDSPNGPWNGLTKREYFAAMAMQGLIAQASGRELIVNPYLVNDGWVEPITIATGAREMADALINELNKAE